jgi:hypothetical protein
MLRCGNVRASVLAVNAAKTGAAAGERRLPDHLIGRENGSELDSPPSTAKAWPLT